MKTKICIVTGVGRGIGAAIAQAFAGEGATVVVTDKNEASAADVAREIGGHHLRLDVASEADWTALAEGWPACDVLVNNAGITGFEEGLRQHDPEHASLADWRAVHAVNLDGRFLGCRYAIGAMRARGAGSIINISSRSGSFGNGVSITSVDFLAGRSLRFSAPERSSAFTPAYGVIILAETAFCLRLLLQRAPT